MINIEFVFSADLGSSSNYTSMEKRSFLLLILFNLVDRSGKGFRMKLEAIRVSRNLRGGGKTSFEKEFF